MELVSSFRHFRYIDTYSWGGRCKEDESTEVGGSLVRESAGSVDQRTDTVRLDGRANEGSTPGSAGRGSLLGLEELLSRVGGLCAAVGVAKEWAEDGKRCSVVEDGTKRNGGWLDGGKVVKSGHSG